MPPEHQGLLSLIPALTALVLAIVSRRTFEALLGACLVGFVLMWILGVTPDETGPFTAFVNACYGVLSGPGFQFVLLVCGLFGSLIALIIRSGGAIAFGEALGGMVKGRRGALFSTWVLGIVIFMDDYLNALTVSFSMRKVTDRFRTSREMLAYIVDSTGAPVCVLVPISTWAVFVGGLLVEEGLVTADQAIAGFIQTIPYNLYAWAALAVVPLVALGIIPALGRMKSAEARARNGEPAPKLDKADNPLGVEMKHDEDIHPKLHNFLLPVIVLIAATFWFDTDAVKGVMTALGFTFIWYMVFRTLPAKQFFATAFEGFRALVYPIAIVGISFVLVEANDALGLTTFIIEILREAVSPAFLPALVFIALSFVTFSTGSYWGTYAVALPIVVDLAAAAEINVWLALGALISSGAFGSHLCPYGDATVLSSAGAGCDNIEHVRTQMPYGLIAAVLAAAGFVVLGMVQA